MKTTYGKKRSRSRAENKVQTRRQFAQLFVCLVLFLVVFIGKEIWPSKIAKTGEQLLAVIRMNTDFRGAFARLGQAMSDEESIVGEIGEFCVSVFAPEREEKSSSVSESPQASADADDQTGCVDRDETMAVQEKERSLCIGDEVAPVDNGGGELPEGYSARWLFLGDMDTVTPVQGVVTSPFGYRDHPTVGRYAVHGGVDIAANSGTEVAAFASGRVEATGEDGDFGRWVKLSHPNGVSSFYAHCSEICVNEGEEIAVGQHIANVGSSGTSTGPHLHFEIMLEDVRLDPMYYIKPGQAG